MLKEVPPKFGEEPCLTTATMRAVEDLEHYHELLADALRAQTFTEYEATILVDVCRGWLVNGPSDATCLWHEVDLYLAALRGEAGDFFYVPAWQREFVARLQGLSALESVAVIRAAQRLRSLPTDKSINAALIAVGLIKAASEGAAA